MLSRRPSKTCRGNGAVRRLRFEALEDRALLAIVMEPEWTEVGPRAIIHGQVENIAPLNQVIGAIEAVAAHPTNPDILYAGSVNGGIWRTDSATSPIPVWTSLTDEQPSLSIGALSVDPTDLTGDTLVAGIGNFSSGQQVGGSLIGGMLTTDGGATWKVLPGLAGQNIKSIFARGQTILASSQNGVFLSLDGGNTFGQSLFVSPLPATPVHLSEDPSDPARFYASSAGLGIIRTDDTGNSWSGVLTTGLTGLANSTRIETSVGAGYVFAGLIDGSSQLSGMFWSLDLGNTWSSMGVPFTLEDDVAVGLHPRPKPGGQGNIHFSILAEVDPAKAGVVYVGGDRQPADSDGTFPNSIGCENFSGRLFRGFALTSEWIHVTCDPHLDPSVDIGANGTSPHADSRDMVFDANGDLIEADDGGIYRLLHKGDHLNRIWTSVNGSLGTTEFYSVAFDRATGRILGGTQDVGSVGAGSPTDPVWDTINEGDGGEVAVDVTSLPNVSIHYSSAQWLGGFERRAYDGVPGGNFLFKQPVTLLVNGVDVRILDPGFARPSPLVVPWVLNAVNPQRMLIGTQFLYESFDFGDNLTPIGGLLATSANVGTVTALAYGGRLNGSNNPDVAWVGAQAGQNLLLRTTAGGSFNPVNDYSNPQSLGGAQGGIPQDIALDPENWNTAFVIDGSNVYMTTDAGADFTNITGNLATLLLFSLPAGAPFPNNLLNTVEYFPSLGALAVGAFNGVYVTLDPTASNVQWMLLGGNLPNAVANDLRYDSVADRLLIGTRGRGAWTLANASTVIPNSGKLVIDGDMDFAGQNDVITVSVNTANPGLLDVFLNSSAPNLSTPLAGVREIVINGHGGTDIILVNLASFPGDIAINGQDGDDIISLDIATFGGSLNIDGGPLNDTILLSPTIQTLDGFSDKLVQVFGGAGSGDTLIVDDSGTTADHDYAFFVDFNAPLSIGEFKREDFKFFEHEHVEQVTFRSGSGSNTYLISGTPADSKLTVEGSTGDDAFKIGTNATLSSLIDIQDLVSIDGGTAGNNSALVDGTDGFLPTVVTVTENSVDDAPTHALFGFDGTLAYKNLDTLIISLGDAMHEVTVESISADTTINTNIQNDTITVAGPPPAANPNGPGDAVGVLDEITKLLTVNAGGLDDQFDIDIDILQVIDASSTVGKRMTLTDTTIGGDTFLGGGAGEIVYDSIAELRIFMGLADDVAHIESTHAATDTVILKTGPGSDITTVANGALTLNDILSRVELDGEDGYDRLTLDDRGEVVPTTVTLTSGLVGEPGDNIAGGGDFPYSNWEELLLETGVASDTVRVRGTAHNTETTVRTGSGDDVIDVDSNGPAAGGLANAVVSHLIIDATDGGALTLNDESEIHPTEVTLIDGQMLSTDGQVLSLEFFGSLGQISYANLSSLTIRGGTGLNQFNVQATAAVTPVTLVGGANTDIVQFDSNGAATPGGHVLDIRSSVQVMGGFGNDAVIVQNQDGAGAAVSLIPSAAQAGKLVAASGDSFFFFGGGSVDYDAVEVVGLVASPDQDTINVAPSPGLTGTVFSINAGGPKFSDPQPGDILNLDLTAVSNQIVALLDFGIGQLSSASHTPVFFAGAEFVAVPSGAPFDLIADLNTPALGGNDSLADFIAASSGKFMTDGTLNLEINGTPALAVHESAVNSLVVVGSADDDTFAVTETAYGLPGFPGTAPDSHTNPEFTASGLAPQNVGIQYDGGPGTGSDQLKMTLITPQNVRNFQDTFQQPNVDPNSGVVNVEGAFTLSYESLSPIELVATGGTLTVDTTLLTGMTDLQLTDLGDGRARISGDGGFEETTFGGFDQLIVVAPNQIQLQSSYWVNTTGDAADINPGDGICQIAVGSNLCTLRAAIEESNAVPGPGNIYFQIPGPGPHTIQPTSALPTITDPVFIDGLSQPGSVPNTLSIELGTNAQIMVEVNGGLITDGSSGLVITSGSSRVRGLAVTGFGYPDVGEPGSPEDVPAGGIVLLGPGYNVIEGNFIGVDPSTGAAEPNNFYGIFISSSHNQIGGPHPASRNLISGNQGFGIQLTGRQLPASAQFTPTEFNRIQGNLIGTDRTGNFPLPNTGAGIVLRLHARNNLIGGAHANLTPVRNIISGNGGPFSPLGDPSGPYQDWPDAPYPLDGGHGQGIHIANLTVFTKEFPVPNLIQGNYIGTNAQGTAAMPNLHGGVSTGFTNNVTIGGASGALSSGLCSGVCNLISGNAQWGVGIANFVNIPSGAVVQGNFIGTDRTGIQPIGNHDDGVIMFLAEGNLIGGGTPDKGNLIAFNGRTGVVHRGHPAWINPSRNTIRLNSIHSNGLLGIDLDNSQTFGDGPTPNDPGDADDGPNGLQNFPVITSAQFGPATFVAGNLNSLALTTFVLDFYASAVPDPSGFGEGQRYLGSMTVQTDASGNTPFSLFLPGGSQPGEFITATATAPGGDTSEFSQAINANIFLDNSVLHVLGTDGDDVIAVTREDDQYVVTADFLPPEMPSLSFDAASVTEINVVAGNGNDIIGVEFKPAEFKPAEFKMVVEMGDGDNLFELLAADVSFDVLELDAHGGTGADRFDLTYQNVAVTGPLTQTISAGNGADWIGLVWDNVSINSSVVTNLKGGAGADVIDVVARGGYVAAGGQLRLSIDGKHGNDRLGAEIVDLLLNGQLDLALSGGHDNDTVAALVHVADRSRGKFSGVLDGGDGDDALLFELLALDSLKIKRALADGSRGLDRCRTSRNVSMVNCEA